MRAIVLQPKVLVVDEATASVDPHTDAIVQNALKTGFRGNPTLLTIAHRLHSVVDSDKVLVMDAGRIAEFGTPHDLLNKKGGGVFDSLVRAAGEETEKHLRKIAKEASQRQQST